MTNVFRHTPGRADLKLAAMAELPCFAGCSRTTLRRLGSLFDSASAPAGALVGPTPHRSGPLYLVLEGEVVTTDSEGPVVLRRGDCWGHEGFFGDGGIPHPAVALTTLSLLVLSRAAHGALVRCAPEVAAALQVVPHRDPMDLGTRSLAAPVVVRLGLAS